MRLGYQEGPRIGWFIGQESSASSHLYPFSWPWLILLVFFWLVVTFRPEQLTERKMGVMEDVWRGRERARERVRVRGQLPLLQQLRREAH